MIMDRVLYLGAWEFPDARDSVLRFRRTAGARGRGSVGGVGCEDCRVRALGDARGVRGSGDWGAV